MKEVQGRVIALTVCAPTHVHLNNLRVQVRATKNPSPYLSSLSLQHYRAMLAKRRSYFVLQPEAGAPVMVLTEEKRELCENNRPAYYEPASPQKIPVGESFELSSLVALPQAHTF